MSVRAQFKSRGSFLLAAAGSAVGLGNIWAFPTQVAQNGGGAFLLAYLLLVFILGYPVLVAELLIGRHSQANPLTALRRVAATAGGRGYRSSALLLGLVGILGVSLILSFYAIVSGWLLGYLLSSTARLLGCSQAAGWLIHPSMLRDGVLTGLFTLLTASVIRRGVAQGIEQWSARLMPLLVLFLVVMCGYIVLQPGAMEGLKAYLVPDCARLLNPQLLISALGQAFFSLSIGVYAMMAYGSYLPRSESVPLVAAQVVLFDTLVAFLAGLLIIPAMFVAQQQGITIYDQQQQLLSETSLVFQVLPALFERLGVVGPGLALLFFGLMVIAALTSAIAMLEVPVLCLTETCGYSRRSATGWVALGIGGISLVIIKQGDQLFKGVVILTTHYIQPLSGLACALLVGWLWQRASLLQEIRSGYPNLENSLFWKIWPGYLRFVCPVLILLVFLAQCW
jgi:NSS family neurotransmitter:Na+ symporter